MAIAAQRHTRGSLLMRPCVACLVLAAATLGSACSSSRHYCDGDPDEWLDRRGAPLGEVLAEFAPVDNGSAVPTLEILPRSRKLGSPLLPRLCVEDADGLGNLDPGSVRFSVNGAEISAHLLWNRVGPNRLCGEPSSRCGFGQGPGAEHQVTARIKDRDGNVEQADALFTPPNVATVVFQNVTGAAGIGAPIFTGNTHTGGVAWIDYNGDGWPDLFVTGGAESENRLFRNEGDKTFSDVTPDIMRMLGVSTAGVLFADIDNDGDQDIYVYSDHNQLKLTAGNPNTVPGHENRLFRNDGGDSWSDITAESGLADVTAAGDSFRTISAAFGDYDRDGCIDLYTVHWRMGTGPDSVWDADRLYRNDCTGHFEDVTSAAGIGNVARKGLAAVFADLTMDGWPDIYVVNVVFDEEELDEVQADFRYGSEQTRDFLFVNQRNGTFLEMAEEAGIGGDTPAGMGIAVADFDNDGDFDIYVSDIGEPIGYGSAFYRNKIEDVGGELSFEEEAFKLGARPLTASFGWGVNAADFNNDGYEDLFMVGSPDRWLFVNNGDGDFLAVGSPRPMVENVQGFTDETGLPIVSGHGTAVADYDGDGDLDLAIWQYFGSVQLLENVSPNQNHWLRVRLRPTRSNRSGIGTLVTLYAENGYFSTKQVMGGNSHQSQSENVLHFGLGSRTAVDRIEVRWPSGEVQVLMAPTVDAILEVDEP